MGCRSSKPEGPAGALRQGIGPGAVPEPVKGAGWVQPATSALPSNQGNRSTTAFLSQVPLFKRLPEDQIPLLAANAHSVDFLPGQVIIRQGDEGRAFFIIKDGQASVMVATGGGAPERVAGLKPGDYFGENALLRDEPRIATITADTHLTAYSITREKFEELGLPQKVQFANRKAVGGGRGRALEPKPDSVQTLKTQPERALITEALQANQNLTAMVPLDDARINAIIDVAWKETVPAGKAIIEEGDLTADFFYLVQEGRFEIFVSAEAQSSPNLVSTVTRGGSFGELALLYLVPRAATVKAVEESVVWVIDRYRFKDILMKASDRQVKEHAQYLDRVDILEPLLMDEKEALASALVDMCFAKDEVILQQGEQGKTFYILYEGEVAVVKDGAEQTRLSAKKNPQFFGERALVNNERRAATVIVSSSYAKVLALDRDSFDLILGPLQDILRRGTDAQAGHKCRIIGTQESIQSVEGKFPRAKDSTRPRVSRVDLVRIGLLGCGGFGAVELHEHKTTGETYALKGLSKGYIVKTGMQESVMNEKHILLMLDSPFIIKLYETYNGSQTLYFLMEPALGGELYTLYNRRGFHGSVSHCLFYIAGTCLAFEHIHERRVIYRDLKPENLLLNEKGYLKVADMGLAKFTIGKTYTTCGTPDYFAPEVIASTGHTKAVDWWGLGILIFELMSGRPPFESASPMQIYAKVMRGIGKVTMPSKCQGAVGDLIKALLVKEPSERLAMRPGGLENIKSHPWYKKNQFNWPAFASLTLEPPFKPEVKSKKDIANFNARKEDIPKGYPYKEDGSGWDKAFATYT